MPIFLRGEGGGGRGSGLRGSKRHPKPGLLSNLKSINFYSIMAPLREKVSKYSTPKLRNPPSTLSGQHLRHVVAAKSHGREHGGVGLGGLVF